MSDKEAIQQAVTYLKGLANLPEEVREVPREGTIRLETIQHFDDTWAVVLSYFGEPQWKRNEKDPEWWGAAANARQFREITMKENGEIVSLRNSCLVG